MKIDYEAEPWRKLGFDFPIILSPALYEAAEKLGHDMRAYIRQERILTTSAEPEHKPHSE